MGVDLNVWTCNDFEGFYPVGSAAVVVAIDENQARRLLDEKLKGMGLTGLEASRKVELLDQFDVHVVILVDGNY